MRLCGRVRSKFAAICAFLQREGNARFLIADATSCRYRLVQIITAILSSTRLCVGVPHTVNLGIHEKSQTKIKRDRDRQSGKELLLPAGNLLQSKYLTQVSLENNLPLFIAIKRILTDLACQRQRI